MLLSYLHKVCDMEKNRYLLLQMIHNENEKARRIGEKLEELKIEKEQKEPQLEELPSNRNRPSYVLCFIGTLLMGGVAAAVIWFVLGFAVAIFTLFEPGAGIVSFMEGPLIAILVIADVIFAWWSAGCQMDGYQDYLGKVELIKRDNAGKEKEYKILCNEVDIMCKELMEERVQCQNNVGILYEKVSEMEHTLERYYGLNILYGKYCCLEAVCKILEYMQSGRCTSLYGPSGAYDTYEREYRAEIMIDKLDTMIYKLDEIKATNIVLSQTMQQVNYSLNEVYRGIGEQQNTLQEIGTSLGRGIGIMEQNVQAGRLLSEITNTNLRDIREFEEYQNFVMKQERLNKGHWC